MATYDGGASTTTDNQNTDKNNEQDQNTNFECNICLDVARDAVVSLCGHLFCWPCLHKWLETRPNRPVCPVCKAGISKDKVIPLYGKDNPDRKDPREKLPPRPQAQRPEPENNYNPFQGFGFGNNSGLHISFGIGAFPFSLLAMAFGNNEPQVPPQSPQAQQEQFLSRLFLWIALLFMFWLIFA
eukprot:gene13856-15304_t